MIGIREDCFGNNFLEYTIFELIEFYWDYISKLKKEN